MVKLRGSRRLRSLLAGLALIAAAVVVAPLTGVSPAFAQCKGCDNVNPNTNGCSPAYTHSEFTAEKTSIRIELRYSYACEGAWVRSTQPGNNRYGTMIMLQSSDGLLYQHSIANDSQEWTNMMRIYRTIRACYGYGYEGPNWYDYDVFECTPWW